jgi:AcrR family transcriptional regulator
MAVETRQASECPRELRADARRNRERILAAASAAFAEQGLDVGVAEIARRAGVGTGTLFRHFPTKRDLAVAVMVERSAETRAALADALAEPDPWRALEGLMTRTVELASRNRCIAQASSEEVLDDPRLVAIRQELLDGLATVLARCRDAGVIRPDLTPADIQVLIGAIGSMAERLCRAQPDLWRRYLRIVLDGLRPDGRGPLEPGPPDACDLQSPRLG